MTEKILLDSYGIKQFEDIKLKIYEKINLNNKIKADAMQDAPGDGWHDNFAAEDAARQERIYLDELKKINNLKKDIVLITDEYKKSVVNINDFIKILLIFSENDQETIVIKLTGKYISETEEEITLNSELGKNIYHKKIGYEGSYFVNNKEIKYKILERLNK